ncbi:MAG TPA: sulfite reductase, partial [Cytophagales bacterium]|nr:sulfite reductase [Cytophagales bacterium]
FRWKSTTRWRRKNFDLHAILGFYAGVLAFLMAYTGLVMTLALVRDATYAAMGGDKSAEFVIPENAASGPLVIEDEVAPIDHLLVELEATYPEAEQFEIHFPPTDSQAIYV